MGVVLSWLVLSLVVGAIRSARGGSFWKLFFLSLLLSPVVGLICALAVPVSAKAAEAKQMATGDLRKCPQCAELVKREAKICRFCHSTLEPLPAESNAGGDNLSAAKNLAASGHSAAEISKELQKWRGLTSTEADALAKSAVDPS